MGYAKFTAASAIAALVTVFGALPAGAQPACPATGTLASMQGNVLVNTGAGYAPAQAGAPLKAGDQITVRGPGKAVIDFGNGRILNVGAASTQAVRAPGCGLTVAQSPNTTTMLIGGVAAAAAVGGAIALASGGGSSNDLPPFRPVSP